MVFFEPFILKTSILNTPIKWWYLYTERTGVVKNLKMYTSEYKNIYLREDLTPLHSKLLKLVKGRDNVKYAFRREYVINIASDNNELL